MVRPSLLLLAVALAACRGDSSLPSDPPPSAATVTLAEVRRMDEPLFVRRTAALRSRTDVQLVVESAGLVIERPVEAGTRVAPGTLLLRLDDRMEEAALKAARARLFGLVASSVDLAAREAAEAAVAQSAEALRRRAIRAPAEGIVDRWDLLVGDYAVPGAPAGRLVDEQHLYMTATVLESWILRIESGGAATFTVPAHPGVRFSGRVVRLGRAALPASGQFEVEVEVAADDRLRAGFLATVDLPVAGTSSVMAVPHEAAFMRHGTWRVFVAERDAGELRARERTVLTRDVPGRPDLIDLVRGVEQGARVVVCGRTGLVDGQRLQPQEP